MICLLNGDVSGFRYIHLCEMRKMCFTSYRLPNFSLLLLVEEIYLSICSTLSFKFFYLFQNFHHKPGILFENLLHIVYGIYAGCHYHNVNGTKDWCGQTCFWKYHLRIHALLNKPLPPKNEGKAISSQLIRKQSLLVSLPRFFCNPQRRRIARGSTAESLQLACQ